MRAGSGFASLGSAEESFTTKRIAPKDTAHGGAPSSAPAVHGRTSSAPSRYRNHPGPPRSQSSWLPRISSSGALANSGFAGQNQSAFHDRLVSPQRFTQPVTLA